MNHPFEQVFKEYQHALYRFAFRITGNPFDAEDAVQEAGRRFFSQIVHAELKSETHARNLLFRIVKHASLDIVRKRRGTGLDEIEEPVSSAATPDELLISSSVWRYWQQKGDLTDEETRILYLNFEKTLPIEAIALVMKMSVKTVQRRKKSAIKKLRIATSGEAGSDIPAA